MNKLTKNIAFTFMLSAGFLSYAQEHIHGQGSLYIVQKENELQLQFIIPAADALSFEHQATNSLQIAEQNELIQHLKNTNQTIHMNGECELKKTDNSLVSSNNEHHEHHNIEVTYYFNCKTPATHFSVSLFTLMPSLTALQVQWVNEHNQGQTKITHDKPFINW